MFSSRNKKNIDTFLVEKAPYQELCKSAPLSRPMQIFLSL